MNARDARPPRPPAADPQRSSDAAAGTSSAASSAPDRVSVPGKLVLLGEYAVLEGASALVAAVNRRALALATAPRPRSEYSEVVRAVLARAERTGLLQASVGVEVDTSAFVDASGQKLGLGSSAAVAVATAALCSGLRDERALELAIHGHRDAAGGEGSGVDVAAAYHGGVIATRRQPASVVPLASRVRDLHLAVFFTGRSARTADLIARCRASASWPRWIQVMSGLAQEGLRAWETQDSTAFLSAAARYGRALAGLGRDASVELVTPEMEAIMRLADEAGAAAKPSGAGGGDVAVLFTRDAALPASIAERTGARLLDVAVDPRGLSRG